MLYLWLNQILTIGILKDGQRSVAVFVMGELVIVQTLVEFIRSDQSWCPRRRICINETINTLSDINRKWDQTVRTVRGQTSLGDWK